ncbi:MAG TPA: DoxX family protein [Longimicrobiales bacterium]|nr:DoxX family protein [Longimicrobiales bacterium]
MVETGSNTAASSLVRGFRAVLRIGAALLFMQHGAQKLLGWFGGMGEGATAELFTLMGLAGVIELVGGLLLLIGLLTRPVAALAAVEMVVAYFMAHMPQGGFPIENQGELALLYALIWAYIAVAGAGPASVDDVLARRGTEAPARTAEPSPTAP